MAKIIGIDLGTTNSAVAYVKAGEPEIIENAEGAERQARHGADNGPRIEAQAALAGDEGIVPGAVILRQCVVMRPPSDGLDMVGLLDERLGRGKACIQMGRTVFRRFGLSHFVILQKR